MHEYKITCDCIDCEEQTDYNERQAELEAQWDEEVNPYSA